MTYVVLSGLLETLDMRMKRMLLVLSKGNTIRGAQVSDNNKDMLLMSGAEIIFHKVLRLLFLHNCSKLSASICSETRLKPY